MSPIFPKSVVLVLLFLMSISVLKIMISLTLLWVSWYLLGHNPVINDLKRIRYMVGLRETSMWLTIASVLWHTTRSLESRGKSLWSRRLKRYLVYISHNSVNRICPIFPKSVVLVLLFLMSISVLKIMISLTLLWVSWYLLVTRLFRLLLIPDQSVWSKTENLLRNASHVLGTAGLNKSILETIWDSCLLQNFWSFG
jgi:hypothetical protein